MYSARDQIFFREIFNNTTWIPGSPTVLLSNMPTFNNTCTLNGMWGGVISIVQPGQVQCDVA